MPPKIRSSLSQEREERKAIRLEDAPFRLRAAGASSCGQLSCPCCPTLLVSPEFGWTLGGMAGAALAGLWMGLRGAWIPPVGRRWMGLAVVFENGSIPPKRTRIVRNLLLLLPYVGWMSSLVWARLDPAGRRPGDRWTGTGSQRTDDPKIRPVIAGLLGLALIVGSLLLVLVIGTQGVGSDEFAFASPEFSCFCFPCSGPSSGLEKGVRSGKTTFSNVNVLPPEGLTITRNLLRLLDECDDRADPAGGQRMAQIPDRRS